MQKLTLPLIILLSFGLSGCVYQREFEQGNVINQEQVAKLKSGMTRNEVRYHMGDPILQNPFNPDRWDYVYLLRKGNKTLKQQRVSVYFKNDRVTKIVKDLNNQ